MAEDVQPTLRQCQACRPDVASTLAVQKRAIWEDQGESTIHEFRVIDLGIVAAGFGWW